MKKIWKTIRHYPLFFIAVAASSVALALTLTGRSTAANWILIATALLELVPLLRGMLHDIRAGKYGVDILAATAIITSVLLQEYWAGIVIVLMLTGGEALEDYAEHRAERELNALLTRAPQKARVLRGRKETEVNIDEVRVGDKVIIRAGELVPVDAVILEGSATFDESSLTGESIPQPKQTGDMLLSGSINLDGPITAKATATAEDSQYQHIVKLVKSAQASQAPIIRLADRYAIPFTIVSFIIAILAWVLSGDSMRFLEVIVVATPCPLILAAPIAIISGMSRSAKHGIIIKNGSSLERLAEAQTFAFDKTGTLTRGELRAERVTTYGKHSRTEILGLAASLERGSSHALAKAIIAKAAAEHARVTTLRHIREFAGKGVMARAGGKDVIVGRLQLLEEQDVTFPKTFKASDHDQTAAYIAIDGELAGVITFKDEVRDESKKTLARLKAAGVRNFMMVTGDNERTANAVAKKLGIGKVVAGALPGDKIHAIEGVKAKPVAFVGDGVNDAPVLTASDIGIALGARGSAAASESADVVVMLDDVSRVAKAVEIAKNTFSIAKQSIFVGIGLSVLLMLVFSTGKFKPIHGAAIQELVDVVVIVNALRAHGGYRTSKKA